MTTTQEHLIDLKSMKTDDILEKYCPAESLHINDGFEIKYRTINVTPTLAKILLDRSIKNRPLRTRNLKYLRKQVEIGNWKLTGEAIKIDKFGKLIDGRHRLTILVETGKTLIMSVTSGLNGNVFTVLDTGSKRDGSDTLAIYGVDNYRLVASAIKLIKQIERGAYGESGSNSINLPNEDFLDYYKKNQDISESATLASNLYRKCNGILPPSVIAAVHYSFSKKSKSAAEDFCTKLCSGLGLEAKTPINALRDRLIKAKMNREDSLLQSEMIAYIIVAWNKYRKGEKCLKLKMPTEKVTIL